jgi:hypothetical protein
VPLKETDLKDLETYKKALRQDLSKISSGNCKFWIYKDVELAKKKQPNFLVLVDENPVKKFLTGKKLVCKGLSHMEEGRVAFEAQTGKVPYNQLKTSIPLFLGKPVYIPANALDKPDEESEVAETETEEAGAQGAEPPAPQAPPPAPPPPPPPELIAAWNNLSKEIQAHIGAHPERKDALTRAAAEIPDLIKANKADEAKQKMAQIQAAIKAPAAPPPPPPPPPTQPSTAAGLAVTWNKMVKDLQAAVAAHPERKDALARASAGIPDLIKANKTAEAKQKMDQVQALLDAPPTATQGGSPGGAAELTARWNALVKTMQAAVAAHPEKRADIVRASAGIPDMLRAGKFDLAKKLMDTVDATLAAPASGGGAGAQTAGAEQTAGQPDAPYKGIVAYRKSLVEFARAKTAVTAQVDALRKAIPTHLRGEQGLADAIAHELNELNTEIGDAIDAAMKASENVASPLTDAIKMKLQKYLAEVQSNPLVKHVDANPFGVNVAVEKTLVAALSNVRAAMPV